MADKAEALQANKNLEGNSLKFKNSFAVLENDVLLDRTNKMGINSKKIDLEFFDIMKDLELARANLMERKTFIQTELLRLLAEEELYWHKRSNSKWLLEGDNNT